MDINDKVNFLISNGFNAIFDENDNLESIINISTGEKLKLDLLDFVTNDSTTRIYEITNGIGIVQDGLCIEQLGNYCMYIKDKKRKVTLKITYDDSHKTTSNLASVSLDMQNGKGLKDSCRVTQGAFDITIVSRSGDNATVTKLKNKDSDMCLQAITDSIIRSGYIRSNPNIKAKIGIIVSFASNSVDRALNVMYDSSDDVIDALKKKRNELTREIKEAGREIEQCDRSIDQIKANVRKRDIKY